MNRLRTSYNKHKSIFLFLFIILIFGIMSGFLLYLKQDTSVRETIVLNIGNVFSHNIFDVKNILIHLGIFLIIIATAFVFLGIPLLLLIIFLEGISIGFIIPIFVSIYKLKAMFTFSFYLIFIKIIYLIILSFLFIFLISFTKNYILYLKTKKLQFFSQLKKMFLLCIISLLNDLTIYFLFNKVLIFLFG